MPKALLTLVVVLLPITTALAQDEHAHDEAGHHHDHLHFAHPLVTESPTPDRKVRLNYGLQSSEHVQVHTTTIVGEYAFAPQVSIEVDLPYVVWTSDLSASRSSFGNVEAALKLASFALEDQGVLIGGGVEFGLPTGSDDKAIGSSHLVQVEPFADLSFQRGKVEAVSFVRLGFPTNQDEGEDLSNDLGVDVSVLFHATSTIEALLELNGETALSSDESETVAIVTPGLRVRPVDTHPGLVLGLGMSIPVTSDKEYDFRPLLSLFYHFE